MPGVTEGRLTVTPHRDDDVPVFGSDYDLERWSTGERDAEGHMVWVDDRLPNNDEWADIRMVTLNFDPGAPEGEGDYRNYPVHPDRPLDPYGSYDPDDPYYYDLDDLAADAFDVYGFTY